MRIYSLRFIDVVSICRGNARKYITLTVGWRDGRGVEQRSKSVLLRCTQVNIIPNYNQQDAVFLDLFISTDALHVSGGSSAHHQEQITAHTASGIVNQYSCLLLSWM